MLPIQFTLIASTIDALIIIIIDALIIFFFKLQARNELQDLDELRNMITIVSLHGSYIRIFEKKKKRRRLRYHQYAEPLIRRLKGLHPILLPTFFFLSLLNHTATFCNLSLFRQIHLTAAVLNPNSYLIASEKVGSPVVCRRHINARFLMVNTNFVN
ncbi:hypothetical protein L6452_29650 [Arctium lappa]|uniref:Uncharacterized protein n=1 Tax=Arctium lappa TaxID=4217 RepID=A0ACB8ZGN7_ARCLA|nr:hypothetical protein L6452_29650 [Arctium lappa]